MAKFIIKAKSNLLTIRLLSISLLIALLFSNCSNKQDTNDAIVDDIQTEIPDYAKYGLKSGIVKLESNTLGIKQNMTMYFDDWGNLTTNDIEMNLLGSKTHIRVIISKESIWQINMINKTATKTDIKLGKDVNTINDINYLTIEENIEMLEQHGIIVKYLQDINIIGKPCKKYSIQADNQSQITMAIWKGIPLSTITQAMGINVTIEAKKIIENADIPSDVFELPIDVEVKE